MKKDVISRRPTLSIVILCIGLVLYGYLCQPAIHRRGFPEIDPFWIAMPWLWVAPITLSALFDGKTRMRRWSVDIYAVLASYFANGSVVTIVPHHVSPTVMLIGMIFYGPVLLIIGRGVEWFSQAVLGRVRGFADSAETVPPGFPARVITAGILISVLSVAFPWSCRTASFSIARCQARSDAARDWAAGKAIWHMDRNEPPLFGASSFNTYSVDKGLMTEAFHRGVTDAVYKKAYRAEIEAFLAKNGPARMAKQLITRDEFKSLLSGGRLERINTFPLKRGIAEISANGNYRSGGVGQWRGEPSKYVYAVTVPEKNNTLVVVTDTDIVSFDQGGNMLQCTSRRDDPSLFTNLVAGDVEPIRKESTQSQ